MLSTIRLTMLLHFIFPYSMVLNTAGCCCQKNSNISRVLFLFVICLKHCNAIFQLRPCPGLSVTMDMKVQEGLRSRPALGWFKDLFWAETWQVDIKDLASSIDGHRKRFLRKSLSQSSISIWMYKPTEELDLTESRKTCFPGLSWKHLAALTSSSIFRVTAAITSEAGTMGSWDVVAPSSFPCIWDKASVFAFLERGLCVVRMKLTDESEWRVNLHFEWEYILPKEKKKTYYITLAVHTRVSL